MGGFTGKSSSTSQGKQQSMNKKENNSHGKQKNRVSRSGENFLQSPVPVSVASSLSVSNEEVGTSHVDASVVRPKIETQKSDPLVGTYSQGKHEEANKLHHTDKSDVAQKSRWGDLEEECVALPPRENMIGVGIKFGSIGDDNLLSCRKHENIPDHVDSYHAQEKGSTASSTGAETVPDQHSSLRCEDEKLAENSKDVKNIPLEHSIIQVDNGEKIGPEEDTLCRDNKTEQVNKAATDCGINNEHLSANDASVVAHPVHSLINAASDIKISEMPEQSCSLTETVTSSQLPEIFSNSTSVEEVRDQPDSNVENIVSGSHNIDALEGGSNESKERFRQRLWCFLFENLNRSVDELYLLCELECDLEQMKEAILVLEESASDFKELIARVEEFEKVKKSSQVIDGVPLLLKSEHRRPHALSWEVCLIMYCCY